MRTYGDIIDRINERERLHDEVAKWRVLALISISLFAASVAVRLVEVLVQ